MGINIRKKLGEMADESDEEQMNDKKIIELEGRTLNLFSTKNRFR